jgi:cytidine deaminase
MAKLIPPETEKHQQRGGGRGEFQLKETECGVDFTFRLTRNRIKVEPKQADWHKALSEKERLMVFDGILKHYRERAIGDSGMQLAAIGITESGDIYIATNTERHSSPYFKQCAELNMVSIMTQDSSYWQLSAGGKNPEAKKLKEVYLVGGKKNEESMKRPICPCGSCTDMLSRVMVKGGNVYMFPLNPQNTEFDINTTAKDVMQVQPGQVWHTSIDTLNNKYLLRLRDGNQNTPRKGLEALLERGAKLPEDRAKEITDAMLGQPEHKELHSVTDLVGALLNPVKAVQTLADLPKGLLQDAEHAIQAMLQSAQNALTKRESVAELDVAEKDGTPRLSGLNHFMVEQIQRTFANRLDACTKLKTASQGEFRKILNDEIGAIRCVVIQLDDNTFRYAVESRTTLDNAIPAAEVTALANAATKLGSQGVKQVWAMEMSPRDIASGVMHTSTKEGVERIVKRSSQRNPLEFHFIPFNDGKGNDKDIAAITRDMSPIQLFPSYFLGKTTGQKVG